MSNKVLIIEDNEQNRYLFTLLLEKSGYTVLQTPDGRSGIDTATKARPDLILLDIQLPDLDGYKVASSLREKRELLNTPIIAVTSYAMVGDREKALNSGCTGYIEKPINPKTFIEEIEKFLISLTKKDEMS